MMPVSRSQFFLPLVKVTVFLKHANTHFKMSYTHVVFTLLCKKIFITVLMFLWVYLITGGSDGGVYFGILTDMSSGGGIERVT